MKRKMSDLFVTWPSLTIGTLVRRYKRFMVDVQLDSGEVITAHCPNSGSMKGCLEQGAKVFLSTSSNPKRKFSKTWELIEMPLSIVVINTLMANRIVKKALLSGFIPELSSYSDIRSEVPYGNHSRIDLLLKGDNASPAMWRSRAAPLWKMVLPCSLMP
jgi:sugar fermentation stimulation protein A